MIRKANSGDVIGIAEVHVKCWWETYADLMPREEIEKRDLTYSIRLWASVIDNLNQQNTADSLYVALNPQNQIIGFVNGGKVRGQLPFDCELFAIYLLKEYQGIGIGKNLFAALVQDLKTLGYRSMCLWVLKDNPSCKFYEKLGGTLTDIHKNEVYGEKTLQQVVYSW